jgi:hypothetical protein
MSTITSTQPRIDDGWPAHAQAAGHALFVSPRRRGDGFRASIRGHILDLADPSAGNALAPTPDDLFIVSVVSEFAWYARKDLHTRGLPDDVSVSASWQTSGDLAGPSDVHLTVTVSRKAEAVGAALAAAFETSLAARSLAHPVVHISWEE